MESTDMAALFTAMDISGLQTSAVAGLTIGVTLALCFTAYKVIKRIQAKV